ncbi:Na+/H+ antiporter subunit C [Paragemmobacter straminiformis]|uniref:Na+/H+ antiporter subunit C n=1 Tax=Paragemmobacter straminiformis TaxID=2045119 RepID=A0A842IDV2_9RHOB|nr:Na+/H+ antiporter subunit C [Gemmobacter straminiformis]MBC2837058.1 Na+/H+ antiporter subunit C [Gemmobacter straminiformis]
MEALVAIAIGLLTATGLYLILRQRTFPLVVGLSLVSYAVNLFLFASGRLAAGVPPIIDKAASGYTDPLPQALVLTAIVISFGMTAVIVIMALGAWFTGGDDHTDFSDGASGEGASGDRDA